MRYLWAIVAVTLIKVTPLSRRYYKRMRINREVRDARKHCVNPRRNEGSWTWSCGTQSRNPLPKCVEGRAGRFAGGPQTLSKCMLPLELLRRIATDFKTQATPLTTLYTTPTAGLNTDRSVGIAGASRWSMDWITRLVVCPCCHRSL